MQFSHLFLLHHIIATDLFNINNTIITDSYKSNGEYYINERFCNGSSNPKAQLTEMVHTELKLLAARKGKSLSLLLEKVVIGYIDKQGDKEK